jgi:hypothetical protein
MQEGPLPEQLGLYTQPLPAPYSMGKEVKRPGREADNSPATSAKVKKTWIYTSTLASILMC